MNLNFKLFWILSTSYFKINLFKYDIFHIHETFCIWFYHKHVLNDWGPYIQISICDLWMYFVVALLPGQIFTCMLLLYIYIIIIIFLLFFKFACYLLFFWPIVTLSNSIQMCDLCVTFNTCIQLLYIHTNTSLQISKKSNINVHWKA